MLRARHLAGLSFAFLVACGSSDGDGPAAPSDPAQPVAPGPTDPTPATPTTPAPPSGPAPVTVTIVKGSDVAAPGIDVVFHDANGVPIGTAKTDTNGKAVSTGATPAMVTALFSGSMNDGAFSIRSALTWTNVRAGDVLRAPTTRDGNEHVGTYAVSLKSAQPGNPWRYFYNVGDCFEGSDLLTKDVGVWSSCMNNGSGPNSIMVKAIDEQQNVLGFAVAKNAPRAAGMQAVPVQVDAFQAPATTTFTASDTGGLENVNLDMYEVVGSTSFQNWDGAVLVGAKPKVMRVAPQSEAYQFILSIQDQGPGARRQMMKRFAPAAQITMSAAKALPRLTVPTPDVTDEKRPSASWTADGSLASTGGGKVSFDWSTQDAHRSWRIIVAPSATNVRVPILPPQFAEYEPKNAPKAITNTVTFYASSATSDAHAFRQNAAVDLAITGSIYNVVLPQNGATYQSTVGWPAK